VPLQLPDFNLSEERIEFRDTLRRFFEEHAPIAETRSVMESGDEISAPVWKLAVEELGLAGIAIPEAYGGQGFGLGELAIALGECGRSLAPAPLFATAGLAARVIESALQGTDGSAWLGPIAEGRIATVAWVEEDGDWDPISTRLTAEGERETVRLSGAKHFVLAASCAERIFVVARRSGTSGATGLGLYAVEADAAGLTIQTRETLDLTRSLSTLHFDGVEAKAVGQVEGGLVAIRAGLEESTALLCAEMVGGMQKILETAVDYASERHQFSRPIGSFQAIKHKCADLLIDFEGARTASTGAVVAIEEADPEAAILVSVAKAHCGPAYVRMTTENMQIQGGVGYTWEYDAHLYYRRALGSAQFLGDAAVHQERLALIVAGDDATEEKARDDAREGGQA
jgi:alkylation response protein AidB-like acyl-CoA dehydrogenase